MTESEQNRNATGDQFCLVEWFDCTTGTIHRWISPREVAHRAKQDILYTGSRRECDDRFREVDYRGWLKTKPKWTERDEALWQEKQRVLQGHY